MKLWRRRKSLLYALHPERIPASGAAWRYTAGLGGLTILGLLVTGLTGFLLALYYVPTPDGAYASVEYINDLAAFGAVMRGLHFWGAQFTTVTVTLHLARVVFTAGYRPPREFNWLIGLALLVVLLLWNFSGFVLRWDDGAYWALLVGSNLIREIPRWGEPLYRVLVGDSEIGANALLRFYAWHVMGLTLAGACGTVYHLWRLRKDGGISRPVLAGSERRAFISRDELFARELTAGAAALAALLLVSVFVPVALGPAASLDGVQGEMRAPWIFLWVQDLLRVLPPLLAGIVLPLGVLLALAVLPFVDRRGPGRARWFARERWRPQAVFALAALALAVLSVHEVWR